ncbi:MAG: MarR family winged helix-turn-helix transcriptional regulator [Promethearchaeota archaeon]
MWYKNNSTPEFRFPSGNPPRRGPPPSPHDSFPFTPFGHSSPPFGPFGPLGGPLPMRHKSFKEIRYFFILIILTENKNGITGYQLQEKFGFPRGNMLRILKELEDLGYIRTRGETEDGRAHKFFLISVEGKKFLDELKKKWANRFALMSELAPPEKFGIPFFRKDVSIKSIREDFERFKSNEDALDFFRGIRSRLKEYLIRLDDRKENLEAQKSKLDSLILKIEQLDAFNAEKIKAIIKEILNEDWENG